MFKESVGSRESDDDGKENHLWVPGANPSYDYTFGYDAMGRFETSSPTGGSVAFQYYYDAASNETGRDNLVNGVNQVYPRDALNRMQYMDVKKDSKCNKISKGDRVVKVRFWCAVLVLD